MPHRDIEESYFKAAIAIALAEAPYPREHYDRIIQRATGKSGKPIYDIVRGKSRDPKLSTMQMIATALGKPLSHFFPPPIPPFTDSTQQ